MKEKRRSLRVIFLIFAIIAFHLGDLYMTIAYKEAGVMIEDNAFAAALVYSPSHVPMIAYKLIAMTIGLSILWRFRSKVTVEMASWIVLAVLILLTSKWLLYDEAAGELHDAIHSQGGTFSHSQVMAELRNSP